MGWDAEGVEIDQNAAQISRKRGFSVHANIGGLPAATFDAVSLLHVIEHEPDPRRLLGEIFRVLTPGGRIVIVTPNTRGLGHRLFRGSWFGLEPPRHLMIFDRNSLRRMVRESGFVIEKSVTSIRNAGGVFALSRGIAATGVISPASPGNGLARIAWRSVEYVEWALKAVDREAGEEIVLVGRRPTR